MMLGEVNLGNDVEGEIEVVPRKNDFHGTFPNNGNIPAVAVRAANKSYGKNVTLKNFNMTVPEGTIYSLLGSSGCGKTTILSAIVGIKNLDAGEIRIFGEMPGSVSSGIPGPGVGHMPQEYSLHSEFTIGESLSYYGYIYEMSPQKLKERTEFLVKFFNLPKPTRRISTLSGGQKRRVSLAIALIHEPRLLILDEPTVGVDQLLRESIWSLLKDLVSKAKTTVIITTHYLEEARGSDTIGLMRNGRLLVEKNPLKLLEEHNATLLEEVVLTLSRNDTVASPDEIDDESGTSLGNGINGTRNASQDRNYTHDNEMELQMNEYNSKKSQCAHNNQISNMKDNQQKFRRSPLSFGRSKALVYKNILMLLRNLVFLAFNFLSPALQIVVVCLAIGNQPANISFGIVNHENPSSCHEVSIPATNFTDPSCVAANWSCLFLDSFPDGDALNLVSYETESEAIAAVEAGRVWGYASFPANFSHELKQRFIFGLFPSNESILGSAITLQMDLSSQTIASFMERTFIETLLKFTQTTLKRCEYDERAGELILQMDEPIYGSKDTTFREFLAPSILLGLIFFYPLCSSSIAYIADKKAGTLDRSLVAGVTTFEIMFASLITQTIVLIGQAAFAFFILTVVFKITVHGSVFVAILLAIMVGISGMSLGYLISTFVAEEIQAVLLAICTFFPNFLLAGMVWPVEGMPLFLQYIGYLLPCTLACEAMRSIISRGWGLLHQRVWTGFASTITWICVYWIATIAIHKIARRRN